MKKVVDSWGFSCIGYELDADNNITKIWCKTCREFYEGKDSAGQKKGVAKLGSETYIKGTKIIKNNFTDHVKSSITHKTAVLRLTEKANITPSGIAGSTPEQAESSGARKQTTLLPHFRKLNAAQ